MSSSDVSFLGIPPELRLKIYECLFHNYFKNDHWAVLHIYTNLYQYMPGLPINSARPESLGILRTCRQINEEASEVLYSIVEINVCIMATKKPDYHPHLPPIGRLEEVHFWRFVRNLGIGVMLEKGRENKRVVLGRLAKLMKALENGKHLKRLSIVFMTAEDEGLPRWHLEVVEALKQMRVDGDVRVGLDDEDEDEDTDSCLELSEVIKGMRNF